ncbi:hypothetical protein B0H10DRAFT_1801126 [Mycena sp. CBHHK59/15]|nr:hypothetical protein B0H10DRAFT_1801126 [Mycena sp. CBHHK59/15]
MLVTQYPLSNHSNMSVVSVLHTTTLEVCATMYGEGSASSDGVEDGVERFYEPSASASLIYSCFVAVPVRPDRYPSYENPVLTATSRSVITDIHQLSRQLSAIDVPRPIAMFCTLFRLQPPRGGFLARNFDDPLFQALRVWTEIGDLCENESFAPDGHRKTIVEHTLNILVLPGIHRDTNYRAPPPFDLLVTNSPAPFQAPVAHPSSPGLPIPGTSLTVPSPFHFKLHIITRLAFNEQGRITHHRDFWDIKDVMGLVPGVSLAQWIATRLAAMGLSYAASLLRRPPAHAAQGDDALERGQMSAAAQVAASTKEVLGMQ